MSCKVSWLHVKILQFGSLSPGITFLETIYVTLYCENVPAIKSLQREYSDEYYFY
jgi:hypothetical protein